MRYCWPSTLWLDREVAVKILVSALAKNPAHVERLRREARILAALDHQNVATIFALGEEDLASGTLVTRARSGYDPNAVLARQVHPHHSKRTPTASLKFVV